MFTGENMATAGDSPVSNDGRGLKLRVRHRLDHQRRDSPVSNDGRGLKHPNAAGSIYVADRFARQQ